MKNIDRKKVMVAILIIGIILMLVAAYLYYSQNTDRDKGKQTVSNTTTKEEDITSLQSDKEEEKEQDSTESKAVTEELTKEVTTTTEKKKNPPLPDNYEWDEKRWGEPPQIVYDFAENQEKFDFIVNEVDSLVSEEEGFTTRTSIDGLYYNSKHNNIENELSDKFKEDAIYLFNYTDFYQITKTVGGHWFMEYDQEEDRERYTYFMTYIPSMTEEQAWDEGYIKVVGDWYFGVNPLV